MNDYYFQHVSHHGVQGQKWGKKNGWKYSNKDSNGDWKIYRKQ